METKLVSVKQAAKMFGFPLQKLYALIDAREVPFIPIQNLSGTVTNKINTKTFAEWLNDMSEENRTI